MSAPGLPDFLIIGAMKSGTTTLQVQLEAQPGIFMTTPKEPNFFSDDPVYAQGMDWYRGLFAAAAPGDLKGEASTHYTKLPTYPETIARMAAVLASPRLVYVIRDPVERALSQYLHEWSRGSLGHDPVAAFEATPELIAYSRYPMQIEPYIDRFGAGNVLLTSLEQITSDPEGELGRIGVHIGAGQALSWKPELGAQNVSRDRIRVLPFHRLLVANPVARALRRGLVPKAVRQRIRNSRLRDERPQLPPDLRRRLEETFAPDAARLAELFPDFPALARSYPFLA
ncbi:sulfotransferase family protein [Seohaeicola zhoushanensis]|uniref:Sulfotransferase n=1 Tax=Seohaeicola zhoushanensis TaxID=1569283 RepID=A0A8J3MB03_9RHOB|nr:sulfotransferase [Seohaeicola zhoushanensis]GHF71716.1 sulfotransferase [Seohaeicola zhoushanensis]